MSNLDKFLERGAECVAGSIILRGKTLANMRNGDMVLTEDGLAELEIEEVTARPSKAAEPKPATKTARATKAAKGLSVPAPVEPAPEVDLTDDLDLGGLLDGDVE